MGLDSKISMKEEVKNKERHFGSNLYYYPAKIVLQDDTEVDALFSKNQLNIAMERAKKNPEDMPEEYSTFFGWLLG